MELHENIRQFVESILEKEYFVVDIQIKQLKEKKKVTIFLDGDRGVSIEVCAKINRALGNYLEEHNFFDSPYTLEVSSPGVDNPLKLPRQYPQHIGRTLQIKDKNQTGYEGKLIEVSENHIVIEQTQGKGKKATTSQINIDFANIETAKVLVSFK
jgi:ribosome maturation factor RimP